MATSETYQPPDAVNGLQRFGMGAALLGVVLTIVGFVMSGQEKFFQAYLVAYAFWIGVVLGSMALLMVQHLSGGAWGVVIRRPLEAAVRTMPLMAFLFMPIVLGMGYLYHWTQPEALQDPVISQKIAYLNTPFFIARQVFYFAVWTTMGTLLTRWSASTGSHRRSGLILKRFSVLSGAGLLIYFLTVTFADGRLDDVGQPALVLDDVGAALHGGPGAVGVRLRASCVLVMLLAGGAAQPRHHAASPPRPRQAAVRVPDAVGVSVVLAVPDHLVGEHRRRDPALPRSLGRAATSYISVFIIVGHFMRALCAAAVARPQARRPAGCGSWPRGFCWRAWSTTTGTWPRNSTRAALTVSLLDVALPIALGGIFICAVRVATWRPVAAAGERSGLDKALHHHVH